MPAPSFAFYPGTALVTGCPCNARSQSTVLHRQYPPHARSARLRLSAAGGPGCFAMNQRGAGTAAQPGRVSSTAWALSGIPPPSALSTHSRHWPARCKTKHGRAAQQPQRTPGGREWPGACFYWTMLPAASGQLRRISFRFRLSMLAVWLSGCPAERPLALYTVILVGGGREGISRPTTANRACRPCLWPPLRRHE